MKPHFILIALLLAPLLPGQDAAPPPPTAVDRARDSTELTDEEAYRGDTVDTTPALADVVRQLKEMITNLRKRNGDDLLKYAAGLGLPEPEINSGVPKFLDLKRQVQELAPNHPRAVAMSKELDVIRKQLDAAVEALRDTLQAKLDVATSRLERAEAATSVRRHEATGPSYNDAKLEFESALSKLRAMNRKLAEIPDPTEVQRSELNRAIREQEDMVEQWSRMLANIVRAMGITYRGPTAADSVQKPDRQPPPVARPIKAETQAAADKQREETIRKALDAQDYMDAKRDFESELEMLQAMHIKRHGMQDATEADLAELDRAIRIQDEAVGRTGKVLAQIAKAKGIIYHHPNEVDYIQKPEPQPPHAANPLNTEKARLESQLKFLSELGGEPLLTYAGNLELRDNPVAELHRRQLLAALDLDELKADGLGADHPKVLTKLRSIESLKAQLATAVAALRETLQAQLTVVNAQLAAQPAKPE